MYNYFWHYDASVIFQFVDVASKAEERSGCIVSTVMYLCITALASYCFFRWFFFFFFAETNISSLNSYLIG